MLSDLRYRVRALFRRAEMERELEEELRFHLEREAEKHQRAGVRPEEAMRRARVAFGGVERAKEESRSGRGTRWLDETTADVRHAGRLLGRSRGFAAVVVLTLALGVGVNTAIFSVLNALLLRPLPVLRPDEVVAVYSNRNGEGNFSVSYPDFLYFRDHATSLRGLAAHSLNEASLLVDGTPKAVALAVVSADYLSLLGIEPELGRFFLPEEDREGAADVAVLSDRFWRTSFGADPGVVGRSVRVNGREVTVVGIAPRSFPGTFTGFAMDLWLPAGAAEVAMGRGRLADRDEGTFLLLGRLAPGVSPGTARVELATLARQLAQAYPDTHRDRGVNVVAASGIHPDGQRALRPVLFLLTAVVDLVVLVTCANLAALLLARSLTRRREIAVRLSLGASRGRLVRQMLTESVLLALLGGAVGIPLSLLTTRLILGMRPPTDAPIWVDLSPDARVLAYATALSVVAGILFGLLPAWRSTSVPPGAVLKDEGSIGARARGRLHRVLVTAQVSVSLVFLVGAGLLLRSLVNARQMDPGFEPDAVAVATLSPTLVGYDSARAQTLYDELVRRVEAMPGVEAVAMARYVPLGPAGADPLIVEIPGAAAAAEGEEYRVSYDLVGERYFDALRLPLVAGRAFTASDRGGAPRVAIVNQRMAGELWPGRDALGRSFRLAGTAYEVVGIARDAKYRSFGEAPRPFAYLAFRQANPPAGVLHVRTRGDAEAVLAAVRREISRLDADLPVSEARSLTSAMSFSLFPTRLVGGVLAFCGGLAATLATVGLYGVLALGVSQRRREIALRIALGARRRDILRSTGRSASALVLPGLALGLLAAMLVTRLLTRLLYGIEPLDPGTFAAVAMLLAAVSFCAAFVPARRATKLDPMLALRHD